MPLEGEGADPALPDLPDLPALALSTREEAMWARQLQTHLGADDDIGTELLISAGHPGGAVRVDRARLWERLRRLEQPWSPPDTSACALVSLAVLLATGGAARVKTCAGAGCGAVFADASHNRNRVRCARHVRARPPVEVNRSTSSVSIP